MYQYKAILKSSRELVAVGHNVEDIEHQVLSFRRKQKQGEHTSMNEPVEIIHVRRSQVDGHSKEDIVKII